MYCQKCGTEFSGQACPNCGEKPVTSGFRAIKCEMCSSNDVVKQDGFYVCQNCGTKYTVEEAKKLIEGTVKIDNSDYVEKYLQNARRAKQKEDWGETEKYYNLVEQNDPTNIEAIFYSSYGKAKSSLIDGDLYKRKSAFKVLQNCISILDDNFMPDKETENRTIIEQIGNDIDNFYITNYVYNQKKNGYGIVTWTDKMETVTLFNNLEIEFCTTLENIAQKIPDRKKVYYYESAIKHKEYMLKNGSLSNPKFAQDSIMDYHRKINKIDPNHIVPEEPPAPGQKAGGSGGCYIATSVYGSYNCPQVWTLRRYRDNSLAASWHGRAFVKVYYALSPTLVNLFGDKIWFKRFWKDTLDKKVEKLKDKGFSDKPYEDKKW